VTIRDRGRVIGLPIINGADGQHMNSPYFPIPYSAGMLQGAADAPFPQLVPRITLADGSVLMPLAWFKDVRVARRGATTIVSWRQDSLDLMGGEDAAKDRRASIVTRYTLEPGRITRSDTLTFAPGIRIRDIALEFATFSAAPRAIGESAFRFGEGEVTGFAATGLGQCRSGEGGPAYRAPTGAFRSVLRCLRASTSPDRPLQLGWTLTYSPH
jgi:hypothetical protein